MEPWVHIKRANYSETCCMMIDCPTCGRMRRALAQFEEWYGWDVTCAGCGDRWQDGEMIERPFAPGWRKERIQQARKVLAGIGVAA